MRNCTCPLTLVDIGGRISAENYEICRDADCAVLVLGRKSALAEWQQFCEDLDLQILAILYTHLDHEDRVLSEGSTWMGDLGNFKRGTPIEERQVVKSLASHLVKLTDE